jgi:hypothetical protein
MIPLVLSESEPINWSVEKAGARCLRSACGRYQEDWVLLCLHTCFQPPLLVQVVGAAGAVLSNLNSKGANAMLWNMAVKNAAQPGEHPHPCHPAGATCHHHHRLIANTCVIESHSSLPPPTVHLIHCPFIKPCLIT